jgi:hypothetical protein
VSYQTCGPKLLESQRHLQNCRATIIIAVLCRPKSRHSSTFVKLSALSLSALCVSQVSKVHERGGREAITPPVTTPDAIFTPENREILFADRMLSINQIYRRATYWPIHGIKSVRWTSRLGRATLSSSTPPKWLCFCLQTSPDFLA